MGSFPGRSLVPLRRTPTSSFARAITDKGGRRIYQKRTEIFRKLES